MHPEREHQNLEPATTDLGQRLMFLSSDNIRDGFWLVLGKHIQLTVQEFYDKFEMKPVMVIIDTAN